MAHLSKQKLRALDVVVLALSVYVLVALVADTLFNLPPEISRVLLLLDNAICIFFLIDFVIRLYQAEDKLEFMKWGWIDLLSSIPNVEILRAGRAIRLIKIIRVLRAFRSVKHIANHLFANKAKGAFITVVILAILLVIFSSVSILQFETSPDSNIRTAEDALWWAYVTITTVGYGDKFPVTTGGRIVGVVLMTAGVGLFGTFTGFVSSWFLSGGDKDKEPNETGV